MAKQLPHAGSRSETRVDIHRAMYEVTGYTKEGKCVMRLRNHLPISEARISSATKTAEMQGIIIERIERKTC